MWAVMEEIRSGKLGKTALERLKHRLLDVRGQQLGHARGQVLGRAACCDFNALADPREILAEAFRFPDDLTGQARARLRTRTRVGTEAANLLLQPLDLGGSCPNGGWDGFVVGLVELEGAQQARQLDVVRADPGLVQVSKEFGLMLIGEIRDKVLKQCLLGRWSVHGSFTGLLACEESRCRIGSS